MGPEQEKKSSVPKQDLTLNVEFLMFENTVM